MSRVMCHVSRVTCNMSHVTCPFFSSSFFLQSGEAYRWRVCYQRSLPRLVFKDGLLNKRACTVMFPEVESYFLCNTTHADQAINQNGPEGLVI